jgi:dipeptidyl aminopeptidase/acylaminoacyl peptidase
VLFRSDTSLSAYSVSGAQISPDGTRVAYVVQQADWDANEFVTQIWIANVATGERYQLTTGKKSSADPQWSSDSKRLAFASERDGKRQIYLIQPAGGEATQLTFEDKGVGAFAWSPDGNSMAFLSTGPESKAAKDRRERYGDFDVIGADFTMNHLWLMPVAQTDGKKPKPEQLTSGEQFTVGAFSWSPDGMRIAFDASRDTDLGSQDTQKLYVLDLSSKKIRKIVDSMGPNSNPKWSPDGKTIAFATANGDPYFMYANKVIATIPAEGGAVRVLSGDFDENATVIDWAADGIYFGATQRTNAHVFRIDPGTGKIARITAPEVFHAQGATFSADHKTMAATGGTPNQFSEVFISSTVKFAPRNLTAVAAQWKDYKLATREVIRWKSGDGTEIEGVLIKPADYDPTRKYPLLVIIHGGPTGVDTPALAADRIYPMERFAARGALILRPNYRGSAGYGAKFRALNVRNLGVGDYADVISGVDYLIGKGLVDKDRVGAMGWSQGGYISAFITCSSDRFKAVSVGAGISDWMTYYVNTDIHPFTRQYLKATPWEDPEIYRKTSPITYVNQAQTPTLIQQGDQDKRVPPPNSYELYQALKDRNIPVKLMFYKGFGHAVNKPKQQRSLLEQNYEWFGKYIWGDAGQP